MGKNGKAGKNKSKYYENGEEVNTKTFDFFFRYLKGEGDYELSEDEFNAIIEEINIHTINNSRFNKFKHNNGNDYFFIQNVSLYGTKFEDAYGVLDIIVDMNYEIVGLFDEYNFNPKAWGERSLYGEFLTRNIALLSLFGIGNSFYITYGIQYDPKK